MSEKLAEQISCGNCTGACCRARATTHTLNRHEVASLKSAGTELKEFLPAGRVVLWGNRLFLAAFARFSDKYEKRFVQGRAADLSPGEGLYGLESDCGYLVTTEDGRGVCGIYDDTTGKRPRACDNFAAGDEGCISVRDRFGVGMDTEEINLNLIAAAKGESASNPPELQKTV